MTWSGKLLRHAKAMRKMADKVRELADQLSDSRQRLLNHARALEKDAAILEAKAAGLSGPSRSRSSGRPSKKASARSPIPGRRGCDAANAAEASEKGGGEQALAGSVQLVATVPTSVH